MTLIKPRPPARTLRMVAAGPPSRDRGWQGLVLTAVLALAAIAPAHAQSMTPLLNPLFQDHAVVQRDQPLRLWGRAEAGERVHVALAGRTAHAIADGQGRWDVRLPPLKAGGPYELVASAGGREQRVADVMVGDVFLCSGQSNMELQVWRTLDARAEIDSANNARIRVLTVPQAGSTTPLETFPASSAWMPVKPESVRDFSAACYYFARELQKTVDVPLGLINAAWGGSRIQAWTSTPTLRALGGYDAELDVLARYADDPSDALAAWGALWQGWWSRQGGIADDDHPWSEKTALRGEWSAAPPQLGAWERWNVPALKEFNGMLWYRASVTLTEAQAKQGAVLQLGAADEVDMTWVNGRAVGSTYGAGDAREYPLPAGLLHGGENIVVVNVLDTYRDGGLAGPASAQALRFADGQRNVLGGWRYRIVPSSIGSPPRAPWQTAAGLSTLYNGMIAPLGHYGLRGMLWYQGESNTSEADRYADLLQALRQDRRAQFGGDLPLIVVQLAGYGEASTRPNNSEWAGLREAQRKAVASDARSALVVAVDIGDRYDIHPPNKQELGRRLARAARHLIYGESLPASGPVVGAVRRVGDAVIIDFADVEGRLVAYGADGPIGFELCGPASDSCRYANAELSDHAVTLRTPAAGQHVTRVRYCWADSLVCTLYDRAGLPAGPFELDVPSSAEVEHTP